MTFDFQLIGAVIASVLAMSASAADQDLDREDQRQYVRREAHEDMSPWASGTGWVGAVEPAHLKIGALGLVAGGGFEPPTFGL